MNNNYLMSSRDSEEYENILILENLVEADLMERILTEEGIPFYIRPWHDINFDGMFAEQKGYGWLMGRRTDEELVRRIYTDRISSGTADSPQT